MKKGSRTGKNTVRARDVYGELTVLSYLGTESSRTWYECSCSCGKICNVRVDRLKSGKTRSCGHLDTKVRNYKGNIFDTKITSVYNSYKFSAKSSNREFELTRDDVKHLIFQPCYYCGSEPHTNTGNIMYNGIDRVDNSRGYSRDNVVTCCEICNRGKRTMGFAEFCDWMSKISRFTLTSINIGLVMQEQGG